MPLTIPNSTEDGRDITAKRVTLDNEKSPSSGIDDDNAGALIIPAQPEITMQSAVDIIDDCCHAGPLIVPAQLHTSMDCDHVNGRTDAEDDASGHIQQRADFKLVITFIAFVLVGALFSVSSKIQAEYMYNYPTFLNVFGCILFVPLCFLYILPAAHFGIIPLEQLEASKVPFAIMAVFDTLSSTMAVYSSVYLPGPLLVLLPQAIIPVSMVLSKIYLKNRYTCWQYFGAAVVICGILVVLEPMISLRNHPDHVCVAVNKDNDCLACEAETTQAGCEGYDGGHSHNIYEPFTHTAFTNVEMVGNETLHSCQWIDSTNETGDTSILLFWSFVLLLSSLPMALSSIYKERKLSEFEFDPIYLNGYLCLFQTPMSALLALPGGILSSPSVSPSDLPENFWDGLRCFVGRETITTGCHPDTCTHAMAAMLFFTVVCFIYVNLMVLLLKYGSANLMALALTCIVPVANLAFALPIVPNPVTPHLSDLLGLAVIMTGILSYRFGAIANNDGDCGGEGNEEGGDDEETDILKDLHEPLLNPYAQLGLSMEPDPEMCFTRKRNRREDEV